MTQSGTLAPHQQVGTDQFTKVLSTVPPENYLLEVIERVIPGKTDGTKKKFTRKEYLIARYEAKNPEKDVVQIVENHFDPKKIYDENKSFSETHLFPRKPFDSKEDPQEINRILEQKEIQSKPSMQIMFTEDGIIHARERGYKKISAVIFANEEFIGGHGFPSGSMTQEEKALINSNARMFMPYCLNVLAKWLLGNDFMSAGHYSGTPYQPGQCPVKSFHPNFGFRPFGGGYALNYDRLVLLANGSDILLESPIHFVPVVVAAPKRYEYPNDPVLYIQHLTNVINAQYDLAVQSSQTLVTGALGCGVFENSPYIVAYLQILLLQKKEYQGLDVVFCIPQSKAEKKLIETAKGKCDFTRIQRLVDKNHSVFNFVTEHFLELSQTPAFRQINNILTLGTTPDFPLDVLETKCQEAVDMLYTNKNSMSLPKTISPPITITTSIPPSSHIEDQPTSVDKSPRLCDYSLLLKMVSGVTISSGILVLIAFHSPIGIGIGVTSVLIGAASTFFYCNGRERLDPTPSLLPINAQTSLKTP